MIIKYIKWELERLHAGVWVGLVAMFATLMMPVSAFAGQLTTRSVTVSNSAGAATGVTYTAVFTVAASQTLGGLKVEICDSPLSTSTCVNTTSAGESLSTATLGSVTGPSSGTWTIGTKTVNSINIGASAPAAFSGTVTVVLNNVSNPTAPNTPYYVRLSTYTNAAATAPAYPGTDFGAAALDTTQSITVAANVQESLTFCTGTTAAPATCAGETGSLVNIGTGADNVLSSSAPSGGISTMIAATNAASGYAITYFASNLSSTGDTITAAGATTTAFPAAGTAMFGLNLKANTSPSITNSANVTGTGSGTIAANYATANQFAFVPSTATTVASATGPTQQNVYTVSYAAQAGNTTKAGAFTTTFNYVATGTF